VQAKPDTFDLNVANVIKVYTYKFFSFSIHKFRIFLQTKEFVMNYRKPGFKDLYLPILFILFIGGIWIQALTSCSLDDGDYGGSSSSVGGGSSSSGVSIVRCPNPSFSNNTLSCGGQPYRTVTINDKSWMAENLNYAVSGSICYGDYSGGDSQNKCDTYGRLYNWETANKVCPTGWHLPSNAEWTALTDYVGSDAGTKLKSKTGWNSSCSYFCSNYIAGTDDYNFSALPGGRNSGNFSGVGNNGSWWSATESPLSSHTYSWSMYYDTRNVMGFYDSKSSLYSVRCVKD